MKIFRNESTVSSSSPAKAEKASSREGKGISRKKPAPPERKNISASEIKEKLAAHVETSDTAKNMALKSNSKKLGEGFLNDSVKPELIKPSVVDEVKVEKPDIDEDNSPNTKSLTIKSDIALNDPKDTNTQEKLKTVLSKGAFNFNPKEREALEKILGQQ
nr:hypothetical protein BHI3_08150 [Bacteriovorax sp. HI3]